MTEPKASNYQAYTGDESYFDAYNTYQQRHRANPRESDKVILKLIRESLEPTVSAPSILDIGCSTGNLLALLRRELPQAKLAGCDLSASSVEACRNDPDLAGIDVEVADALALTGPPRHHIAILNAVTCYFEEAEFARLLANVGALLYDGGRLIVFDWFHAFAQQQLCILEKSQGHPEGVAYHLRSIAAVKPLLRQAGFDGGDFRPFELPIDLPFPGTEGEVVSYTQRTDGGGRLCFRGVFFQPWCHLVARKTSEPDL